MMAESSFWMVYDLFWQKKKMEKIPIFPEENALLFFKKHNRVCLFNQYNWNTLGTIKKGYFFSKVSLE
jgi:hypothetical protein